MENNRGKVKLKKIINEFHLEILYASDDIEEKLIHSSDVHRPGIQLSEEYYDYFDHERIQILGKVEHFYMLQKTSEEQKDSYEKLMSSGVPAVIVTRGLDVPEELISAAKKTTQSSIN